MNQLQILRQAREDMQKSADWYNEQQAELGTRFLKQVVGTFRLIEANLYTTRKDFQKSLDLLLCRIFHLWLFTKLKSVL